MFLTETLEMNVKDSSWRWPDAVSQVPSRVNIDQVTKDEPGNTEKFCKDLRCTVPIVGWSRTGFGELNNSTQSMDF